MLFHGTAIKSLIDDDKVAHVQFDRESSDINKFDKITIEELTKCIELIAKNKAIKGIIFSSKKDSFIVGADITEFLSYFKKPNVEMEHWLLSVHKLFNQIEDFPFPTIAAINGMALGGGFELCLATTFRICEPNAKIGLPETQLGIIPGWGGCVRLPRIAGADNAIDWITSGKHNSANDGQKIGVIDGIITTDLIDSAKSLIERCHQNKVRWKNQRTIKTSPLKLNHVESIMAFETAKGFVGGIAGPNYSAPVRAIEVMQATAKLDRDDAIKLEAKNFAELTKLKSTESLVRVFLGNQHLKKVGKQFSKNGTNISKAAVLGAGIMGGGIAYQSSSKNIPIIMKDISDKALELGISEATKLLDKQIQRKKIEFSNAAKVISNIIPTTNYSDFKSVNLVVEAVVENEKIKKQVLSELENVVTENAVLTSNTSTISINKLAKDLKRPEKFCGMHFFNPVFKMPLVEVIRGEKTSPDTIAQTVKYALAIGKTPIVVNDCPGFLVNRILFPYFIGFSKLLNDHVDFTRIDKIMEKFGWPMGPAYLLDVVGIDTGFHAATIMGNEFPRMKDSDDNGIKLMFENRRYGQKNGIGFYSYAPDKKGAPKKSIDKTALEMMNKIGKNKEVTDEEIVERMMIPMIFESIRCLEDKIVDGPIEVDMGLLLGLGFPPFRAGALKYADDLGITNICEITKKYEHLGELYKAPNLLLEMSRNNSKFYNN